jgi:hypothetical protein
MIIEYTRPAKCKDCIYCGYYYPKKKNGGDGWSRRHKCKITGDTVLLSDRVCDSWKMGCGMPDRYDKNM